MESSNAAQGGFAGRPLYAPPSELAIPGSSASPSTRGTFKPFNEDDPRVYFDKRSGTWRCETDVDTTSNAASGDVVELEWEPLQRTWVPVLDDDLMRAQQAAYSVAGVDEETPAAPVLRRLNRRQRSPTSQDDDVADNTNVSNSKRPSKQARMRVNTSVFVTGLPLDCDKHEIAHVFSRYGVLNESDDGEPRIKLYTDERTGTFKGEALVTYFKEESVELAVRVLDESSLRAAEGKMHPIMRVMQAEFASSGGGGKSSDIKELDSAVHNDSVRSAAQAHTQQQAPPPSRPALSEADRKRAQKRYAKMNNKLLEWDSDSTDDNDVVTTASGSGVGPVASNVRQVCLRRMFTIAELEDDPSLLLDLKEEVREECESLGKVTNVVLWDKEPEGIMTIKFADHNAALACVEKMNGRFFDGRQVIAHLLAGKPRFRRSGKGQYDDDDDSDRDNDIDENGVNAEEKRRQDAFGNWLEGESS